MERARRKLRACLILMVTAAVIIGVVYYFHDVKGSTHTGGTLVLAPGELCGGRARVPEGAQAALATAARSLPGGCVRCL